MPIQAVRKQAEICLGLIRELESAVAQGHPLDQYLAQYYRQHREFGSRDRRFFSALAFAWFRWRGWLSTPSQPDALNCVLAWLLDSSDMHPAIEWLASRLPPFSPPRQALGSRPVNEKVMPQLQGGLEAVRQNGPSADGPFYRTATTTEALCPTRLRHSPSVTEALHDKARGLGQWLKLPPPNIEALVPSWFADALFYPTGADRNTHRHRCLQAFQARPPTWLRTRVGRESDVLAGLQRHYATARISPALSQAICLPNGGNREILNTMPEVEIQDLASQCVGRICGPGTGEHWWDACAGSGGKSFHLADLMNNTGSILATDTRAAILKECRRRMIRNRIKTLTLRTWNGTHATAPDRLFDGVLVDAPCSGIGTWPRNPDARWRTAPDTIARNAGLQSDLLNVCADRVQPGGRLVYAVCTLTGAETAGVIEEFLARRSDFHLEPAPHPLTGEPTPGLVRIWPWEGDCNGMFITCLKKQ